ncbi:MAG TPA: ABC-type transport auxiliary lipoprotein family protein [Rhizomicrobium sp.]|jgi:cholesterol transport system auxiliary component
MSNATSLTPSRRLLLLGGASLGLAACSGIIGPVGDMQLYLLKPSLAKTPGRPVNWRLTVLRPDSPQSLDTNRIAISRSPTTMDYYAGAIWTDRLPPLVQDWVVQAFETSGRIGSVAADSAGARSDYDLDLDVRNFEARYDTPDGAPTAVVRIHAKLLTRLKQTIIDDYETGHEAPASANSIDAAVMAFDQAFGAVLADIVDWTLKTAPST